MAVINKEHNRMEPEIYKILGKHFRNEITSEEKHQLEEWLHSDENKNIFAEIENIWKLTGRSDFNVNPDIDKEWARFNSLKENPASLEYLEVKKNVNLHEFKKWGLRIAAILLVGITIYTAFKILKPSAEKELFVSISSNKEIKEITLPDGSVITMNKETTIQYPAKFKSGNRKVTLTGEAFFEVTKGNGTFTVLAGKTRTIVLGTKFNINASADKEFTELYVSEGKVQFSRADTINNEVFAVGDIGIYNNISGKILREKSADPNKIAWKTGELIFNNCRLDQIQSSVSEYFSQQIIVDPEIKNLQFTGRFNQPKLDEFLEVIATSLAVNYIEKNDTIYIMRSE
jgi:transmembrane sensor